MDDEGVEHLVDLLDDRVDLARAQADAAAVEGRVGPPGDDRGPPFGEQDPIPEAPHAREMLEVRLPVARPVGVVPEADGHRGHGLLDDELPELADHGRAVRPERVDVGARHPRRHLPGVDGKQRDSLHDARADVGATAADVDVDVRPELLVEPLVPLEWKRRARLADHAHRGQVEQPAGLEALLAARHRERRAQPEERRPRLLDHAPLERDVGVGGVAVDHHDRRAVQQHRDEGVPHHPGRRREPLEAVTRLEVPAEAVVLQMLEQDAAVAVHDRLRKPGRPGREEHVERVVERERVERELGGLGKEVVPGDCVGKRVIFPAGVRDVHDGFDARKLAAYLRDLLAPVDVLLAVPVAGDGQDDLRLELPEAVEHAAHAELGWARRPDRAETCAREEADERLRDVREVGDYPVSGADAQPLQAGAGAGDLPAEVAERQLARWPRLRVGDDGACVEVLVAADHVLGEVQARAGEPLGPRHLPRAEHPLVPSVRTDFEELPHRRPEPLEVGDGPAPELVVSGEREASFALEPAEVATDHEALPRVRGR